ncbi:glycerol kinase [Bartonella apihabitans]|uniref:Glycerol kinase n=2 Tax=Bartonella apihabitans TaxID=2750929 RepID=A0A1U9M8B9_9HYPH|nr:glycerol kinase [Bartonella apihabitans]
MLADAQTDLKTLRVDGGAVANNFLMQFQSDILQKPVERPQILEVTAFGSAYLAGLAVGYWSSLDELRKVATIERVFKPSKDVAKQEKRYAGWRKAVERACSWDSVVE